MDSEKILEIIDKSKGYDMALMTTFNFEVGFFEKAILSRMFRNNIKKISVFVDAKELTKAVEEAEYCTLGKRYAINPVSMKGSFHPKLILLLGEKKARLIIGSANLKLSGYYINNEVFNYLDYNSEHQEFRDVICAAISFFQTLSLDETHTYQLDGGLFSEINNYPYYRPAVENGEVFFLHNLNESILDQILTILSEPVHEVHVAVPYYDNDMSALHILQDTFSGAAFRLYLQRKKSTFPESLYNDEQSAAEIKIFEKMIVAGKENSRFFHGKVFLFKTETSSFVLYGSSNCTQSALTRTIKDGNVECNLFVKGALDDNDSFFSGFVVSEAAEVESHLMTFTVPVQDNFFFMYGEAEDTVKLHIGYHTKPKDVAFFINEEALAYYEENGQFIIELELFDIPVFDIRIAYDGENETVRCWYNDNKALKLFRIDLSDDISLVDKEDYASGEKFKEEYEKLLQAELACIEDIEEWERINRSVTQPAGGIDNDAVTPDEEEDFIVYVDLKDEDFAVYQRYKTVEHIRGRIRTRFLKDMSIPLYYRSPSYYATTVGLEQDKVVQRRPATSEEKRFERFVKRKVRNYICDDIKQDSEKKRFVDRLSYGHYFGIVTTIFEIIQKNRINDELIEDIFVDSYVISTRISLLTTLIRKLDLTTETPEDLIRLTFGTILDNHVRIENKLEQNEKGSFEMLNRKLLLALEKKIALRTCYEEYLLKLENGVFTKEAQEAFEGAKKYIESLYGYKDTAQIHMYLIDRYGESSTLELINNTAKITIFVEDPSAFMKPDDVLVREISNYSQNVSKLASVRINIMGIGDSRIERIEHLINLEYRKLTTNIIRRNGINSMGKPRYYSF